MKQHIILLTGASGSGKTSVLKVLRQRFSLGDSSFNHFDDIGVPSLRDMIKDYGSPEKWQEEMTRRWIKNLRKIKDKEFIFLEGSFNPEFVALFNIKPVIVCLYADRALREERLRLRKDRDLITQDMENFSQFLLKKTLEIGGSVINTTYKSITEVVEDIVGLILENKE